MAGAQHSFRIIIECPEAIPCDPCVDACPYGAVSKDGGLCSLPVVDAALCQGCLNCLPACPGQAIYAVEEGEEHCLITFPYEFYPLPAAGEVVQAVDRAGQAVCEAVVERVRNRDRYAGTALLTIKTPKEHAEKVRFIRVNCGGSHE